jgi:hypothetical protein
MRIMYRYYNNWNKEQRKYLSENNIQVEDGFSKIDIFEEPNTTHLIKMINEWGVEKSYGTEFSKEDIKSSDLFAFIGVWENGYPQPESIEEYQSATYDTSKCCKECSAGLIQDRPFRLKRNVNWGNKIMFELGWVYDEIFMKKSVFDNDFKDQFNLKCRDVVSHKTSKVIEDTVQIEIPTINRLMKMKDYEFKVCKTCNRRIYTPQIKGFIPNFDGSIGDKQIFKSIEFFGEIGGNPNQRIFITKKFYQTLVEHKLKPNVWVVR